MSASLSFFLSLSQQAYKYFWWNFTKRHILHSVNLKYTNSSPTTLPNSLLECVFVSLTLDSWLRCPVLRPHPGKDIPLFKGRLRGKWGRISPHLARVGSYIWHSLASHWLHKARACQVHSTHPILGINSAWLGLGEEGWSLASPRLQK